MKKKRNKNPDRSKWLTPRSVKFDKKKLDRAKELGVIKELNTKCREALDKLIGL